MSNASDLARELIRLREAAYQGPVAAWAMEAAASNNWAGNAMLAGLPRPSIDKSPGFTAGDAVFIADSYAHARTIAEALLAAEGYIATLEFANEGHKAHVAAAEQRIADAFGVAASIDAEDSRDIDRLAADLRRAEDEADGLRKRLAAAEARVAELEAAMVAMMEVQDCTDDCWCVELDGFTRPKCEACVCRAVLAKGKGTP